MIMKRLSEAGFDVHFFEAESLADALDDANDLLVEGDMDSFDDLMTSKYQEIPPTLFDDLQMMGIESPIIIEVEAGDRWRLCDGHHRMAWALVHNRPVPVLFVDETVDPIELWLIIADHEVDYDYV